VLSACSGAGRQGEWSGGMERRALGTAVWAQGGRMPMAASAHARRRASSSPARGQHQLGQGCAAFGTLCCHLSLPRGWLRPGSTRLSCIFVQSSSFQIFVASFYCC